MHAECISVIYIYVLNIFSRCDRPTTSGIQCSFKLSQRIGVFVLRWPVACATESRASRRYKVCHSDVPPQNQLAKWFDDTLLCLQLSPDLKRPTSTRWKTRWARKCTTLSRTRTAARGTAAARSAPLTWRSSTATSKKSFIWTAHSVASHAGVSAVFKYGYEQITIKTSNFPRISWKPFVNTLLDPIIHTYQRKLWNFVLYYCSKNLRSWQMFINVC